MSATVFLKTEKCLTVGAGPPALSRLFSFAAFPLPGLPTFFLRPPASFFTFDRRVHFVFSFVHLVPFCLLLDGHRFSVIIFLTSRCHSESATMLQGQSFASFSTVFHPAARPSRVRFRAQVDQISRVIGSPPLGCRGDHPAILKHQHSSLLGRCTPPPTAKRHSTPPTAEPLYSRHPKPQAQTKKACKA